MFRKVLIANRGEIALRVIAACKDLGIRTVAVYSEADRTSLHVRFADEALCIGPAKSADSYLNIPAVISAAEITDVDAIHPGYGFLSENPGFAEVCEMSGITFIGPRPDVVRLMGEKEQARRAMAAAGLPVLPGSDGLLKSEDDALGAAGEVGYPVIIKAAAGGGGRGMRIVREPGEMAAAFHQAQHEAAVSFQSSDVYLEKYIERPRHIEFQVLGDSDGAVVVLGERECTIQRRHQKLLEESPSPRIDAATRSMMSRRVAKALQEVSYTNAGTVEFLMDEDGTLYFIEMNTRIQVEHPVTEMVTGVDLVKAQILIAGGEPVSALVSEPVELHGHAIECRINAESPQTFAPSAGRITKFCPPGMTGIRLDSAAHADCMIHPYYDSLVAKLIAHGRDRTEAITRMQRALDMFVIEGILTSIPIHQRIMADPDFVLGNFDTNYVKRFIEVQGQKVGAGKG
ncbi:MAG TPA: acetyl-CoA carboxylase biotin carboxylase subunit [Bryobacterales bacterium]|nr:acetyl-CoA carboxylase biotin carboxylase subunit [Bryobacterales bacterium]